MLSCGMIYSEHDVEATAVLYKATRIYTTKISELNSLLSNWQMLVCEVCFVQNLKSDFFKNFYTKKSTNSILIKDSFYANCALVKLQKRFSKQCRKIAFCYFRRFRGCPYDPISALKMHQIRWFFFGLNGPFNRSFSTRFNVVQSTKETKIFNKKLNIISLFFIDLQVY